MLVMFFGCRVLRMLRDQRCASGHNVRLTKSRLVRYVQGRKERTISTPASLNVSIDHGFSDFFHRAFPGLWLVVSSMHSPQDLPSSNSTTRPIRHVKRGA